MTEVEVRKWPKGFSADIPPNDSGFQASISVPRTSPSPVELKPADLTTPARSEKSEIRRVSCSNRTMLDFIKQRGRPPETQEEVEAFAKKGW